MNSPNVSQVTISNVAQQIPKITLGGRIKACTIIGANAFDDTAIQTLYMMFSP